MWCWPASSSPAGNWWRTLVSVELRTTSNWCHGCLVTTWWRLQCRSTAHLPTFYTTTLHFTLKPLTFTAGRFLSLLWCCGQQGMHCPDSSPYCDAVVSKECIVQIPLPTVMLWSARNNMMLWCCGQQGMQCPATNVLHSSLASVIVIAPLTSCRLSRISAIEHVWQTYKRINES